MSMLLNNTDLIVRNILCNNYDHTDISLINGLSGESLMLYDCINLSDNILIKDKLDYNINFVLENIDKQTDSTFGYGIIGVLYALVRLNNLRYVSIDCSELIIQNKTIIDNLIKHHSGNYDLMRGLLGIGVYCLEIYKFDAKAKLFLALVIDALLECYSDFDDYKLIQYTAEKHSDFSDIPYVNTGLLHGMTSVISFFLLCLKEGYVDERLQSYIQDYLNIIVQVRLSNDMQTFPRAFSICKKTFIIDKYPTNLFYCNGDLGIINTFLIAFDILADDYYYNIAQRAYVKCIKKIQAGIVPKNKCFCHGLAGLYYFVSKFNKYFKIKEVEPLLEEWKLILYNSAKNKQQNLLNGYKGIIMSLLSHYQISQIERILLLA